MKKLKSKIFFTIFIILTFFLSTIVVYFNFQDYHRSKEEIEQNLFRMNKMKRMDREIEDIPFKREDVEKPKFNEEDLSKRFLDATIYTILLNDENEIIEVISHTEDGTIQDDVKSIADSIIKENQNDKKFIGNLYIADYSYNYSKNNYIVLIDNNALKERLVSSLRNSIILFIFLEVIIVGVSQILSKWIIKPVIETFEKQKQFIADASHELKTPLSVIMASAEALEDNPKEAKWLSNIKNESESMSKLIKNLLDLAKIENENTKKVYENVNLSKIVEMSVLSLESLAFEKDIKLDYDISDNISFSCNSDEMKQLLNIILDNAIKHSSKKGKIFVELKEDKNSISLEIKNKGDAIPKGEEEKIFERFYRVDKARNRGENRYGLGLAIAKGIVLNHNGVISASSSHGFTTFKIIFKK